MKFISNIQGYDCLGGACSGFQLPILEQCRLPVCQNFRDSKDSEAIFGSLADDIAGIYHDLKKGLELKDTYPSQPEAAIWEWRFQFYCHWGKHAIDALLAMHFHLQDAT